MRSEFKEVWIDEVKNAHKGMWFSSGNVRMFKSRTSEWAIDFEDHLYFVSSEVDYMGTKRVYSIMRCCKKTGNITTVGEFGQYKRAANAKYALVKYLRELRDVQI